MNVYGKISKQNMKRFLLTAKWMNVMNGKNMNTNVYLLV